MAVRFIFPQFCKSDMPGYWYLEVFQRVPWTSRQREWTLFRHLLLQLFTHRMTGLLPYGNDRIFTHGIIGINFIYLFIFIFCRFYRCVSSGESLTNWINFEWLYVVMTHKQKKAQLCFKFVSVGRSLHIDNSHTHNSSFLIISTLSLKCYKFAKKWHIFETAEGK